MYYTCLPVYFEWKHILLSTCDLMKCPHILRVNLAGSIYKPQSRLARHSSFGQVNISFCYLKYPRSHWIGFAFQLPVVCNKTQKDDYQAPSPQKTDW